MTQHLSVGPAAETPQYISLADGAHRSGLNERTLRRYIAAGLLTGYRVGPRAVRIDARELEDLFRPIPAGGGAA